MAGRGNFFALPEQEATELLSADEDETWDLAQELGEAQGEEWFCYMDKAWDALHRCLTDGTLNENTGTYPLNRCLLGGKELCSANDDYVYLITAAETRDAARALADLDENWLRERYATLADTDYAEEMSDEDLEYTLVYFRDMRQFYQNAAQDDRAVIFTFGV